MSKSEKRRIYSIARKAERVIGACQPSVDSVYLDLVRGKLEMVWCDNSHPLYGQLGHSTSDHQIFGHFCDDPLRFVLNLARL